MNGSAVVIGATGGIGRAMVERIVTDGAFDTVWAVSRSGADVAVSYTHLTLPTNREV